MLDILTLSLYLIILFGLGLFFKSKIHSVKDYIIGHQSVSWLVIMATLSASFLGGGFTVGIADKASTVGLIAVVGMFGFSLKEIVVGFFLAPRFSSFSSALSAGDILSVYYGKLGKCMAGLLGAIMCIGIVGAQVNALKLMIQAFLHVTEVYSLIISVCILILYTVMGGLSAIIWTDIIQFILLVIGIPLTLIFGVFAVPESVTILDSALNDFFQSFFSGGMWWSSLCLMGSFFLGETLVPPYIQRLLIGKNTTETQKGTISSGLLSIPFFIISGCIGILAASFNTSYHSSMFFMVDTVVPVGLKGIFMIGIVSAVMSTADSFLHAGAVSFVHDFWKPLSRSISEEKELFLLRLITVLFGLFSLVAALSVEGLIDLCLASWAFWSPSLLFSIVMTLYKKKISKGQFLCSALLAGCSTYVWGLLYSSSVISSLVVGVVVNAVSWIGFYLYGDKRD